MTTKRWHLPLWAALLIGSAASTALASPSIDLRQLAPFARALVEARFLERQNDNLVFTVERVFAGPAVERLEVRADWWRDAWGRPEPGFAGFFVYSNNPSVDIVFPIEGERARVFFQGSTVYLDPPPEWAPLDEVEAELALTAARRQALELSLLAEPGETVSAVFRNGSEVPLVVNLDSTYRFQVRDLDSGKYLRSIPLVADPWDCTAEMRTLLPGEQASRQVPAEVQADLGPGRYRVSLQLTSGGGCRRGPEDVPEEDPTPWLGRRDAEIEIGLSPPSED